MSKQYLNPEQKLILSQNVIHEWYNTYKGKVFIAFGGDAKSCILVHLVRSLYKEVPVIYVKTDIDYPDIEKYVKKIKNSIILKSDVRYDAYISKYGYQVYNKDTSRRVRRALINPETKHKLTSYTKTGKKTLNKDKTFLLDAPFKINDKCCKILKWNTLNKYANQRGIKPFFAKSIKGMYNIMRSNTLVENYNKYQYSELIRGSYPLLSWEKADIDKYIMDNNIKLPLHLDSKEFQRHCMLCLCNFTDFLKEHKYDKIKYFYPEFYEKAFKVYHYGLVLDFLGIQYNKE